eukprot:COSAG05_NODE_7450_length_809_cov_2.364789_1_plen_189_part_01
MVGTYALVPEADLENQVPGSLADSAGSPVASQRCEGRDQLMEKLYIVVDEDGSDSLDQKEVNHLVGILRDDVLRFTTPGTDGGGDETEAMRPVPPGVQQLLESDVFGDMCRQDGGQRDDAGSRSDQKGAGETVSLMQFRLWWRTVKARDDGVAGHILDAMEHSRVHADLHTDWYAHGNSDERGDQPARI